MTHLLQRTSIASWARGSASALAVLALLAATAFAPRAVQAQVVFDTFDDGDVSDVFVFSGGADGIGIGVGPTDGVDGTQALSVGINPGAGGGFAGFGVPGGDGVTDISGAEYLTFFFRPTTVQASNLPLTLEINLQEDVNGDGMFDNGGTTEDEFRVRYRLETGSGYQLIQIPLASFVDENAVTVGADDGFDFTKLLQVVFAFGGLNGPEFAIALDELAFGTGIAVANEPGSVAGGFALSSAYPNPFVSQTRFELTLERTQSVRVEVFDVLGRRVDVVHEGTLAARTPHAFAIDGRDLPSGMYFYRVTGDSFAETRSLVLVK